MRVVNLKAENVKRLKAVDITPEGDVVVLAGANGQGKSSVLDAMWLALGGGAASRTVERPVRDGADAAHVRLDLGDLVVTRKWSGARSTLAVETKTGAPYSKPQQVLDQLAGRVGFDPLAFISAKPREQRDMLLEVVDLPFDPDQLEADRKAAFDRRTEVNRRIKAVEGALAGMAPVPADTPDEELSVAALAAQYNEAENFNHRRRYAEDNVTRCQHSVDDARRALEEAEAALERAQATLEVMGDPVDTAPLLARVKDAENVNANVRAKQERADTEAELAFHQGEAAGLTDRIARLDAEKADGLAQAAMPVEGLGFDEDGVTLNGRPFSAASSAEKLRAAVAVGIATSPTLRVMWLRDGSLLDSTSMALLAELAQEQDFQLWVERVDESGTVGIVLEDGEVAA